MKFQILFSAKNKENVINLSFAEFAQRLVMVKERSAEDLMSRFFNDANVLFLVLIFFIKTLCFWNCLNLSFTKK